MIIVGRNKLGPVLSLMKVGDFVYVYICWWPYAWVLASCACMCQCSYYSRYSICMDRYHIYTRVITCCQRAIHVKMK
jgi:hypothetical protein